MEANTVIYVPLYVKITAVDIKTLIAKYFQPSHHLQLIILVSYMKLYLNTYNLENTFIAMNTYQHVKAIILYVLT